MKIRYDRCGAIFLDGVANIYPKDKNIVLYGHNMSDGSMFGELKKYKDKTYFEGHPGFGFNTLYEKSTYQIAVVLVTDISDIQDFCYYNLHNYDEQEFPKFKERFWNVFRVVVFFFCKRFAEL